VLYTTILWSPMHDEAVISSVRPAQSVRPNKVLTQSRKQVNAHLVQDYRDICRQLDEAVSRVRDLVAAKTDLELLAQVCHIVLDGSDDRSSDV
jgi:hypothetical protein